MNGLPRRGAAASRHRSGLIRLGLLTLALLILPCAALADTVVPATSRVSIASDGTAGNHVSEPAQFSADGHVVAFASWADNLVPGDDNSVADDFVRERWREAPWNINRDGVVDTLDVGRIGLHWQEQGPPAWLPIL